MPDISTVGVRQSIEVDGRWEERGKERGGGVGGGSCMTKFLFCNRVCQRAYDCQETVTEIYKSSIRDEGSKREGGEGEMEGRREGWGVGGTIYLTKYRPCQKGLSGVSRGV